MLKEKAKKYYIDQKKNCAVSVLMAGNEEYQLGLTEEEMVLITGFGGGMGCGDTCGALAGSIAVMSKMFVKREDFREQCANLVKAFINRLGSTQCTELAAKNKTPELRCFRTVELACEVLENMVNSLQTEEPKQAVKLPPEEIKRVKGLGFLQHKDTEYFNGRIITRNGRITPEETHAIAKVAAKYGDGHLMLTTRLTIEVSGIHFNDIEAFRKEIMEAGLSTGGTGSKVRPVVSCKGTTCQYGLCDTYDLSEELHERFYKGYHNVTLPHKFKIAIGGCPNNCVKPNLNDIGIIGQRIPKYDSEKCKGCKKCAVEKNCPIKIAKVIDGKLVIDEKLCNHCGRCIGKCPFGANDEGEYGFKVYIGGRWGKNIAIGSMLDVFLTDKQQVFDLVEKTILFFREDGIPGERLSDTVARLGFEYVQAKLLSDDLLKRKNEILGLDVTAGATC